MRVKSQNLRSAARKTDAPPHNSHAFTLIELLTVVATVAILLGLLWSHSMSRGGCRATRNKCHNNLKNIGLAFRIYATDNNDRFPWEISDTNAAPIYAPDPVTYLRPLSNEISTPVILNCPEDKARPLRTNWTSWTQLTRTNLSYFISADASETLPQSFLAGDRNITNKNGRLRPGLRGLSRIDNTAGWDDTIHENQGNTCMGDGSVQGLSAPRLREQLHNSGQTTKYIKLSVP
jgi:Tfp pilus assembly protein PilE